MGRDLLRERHLPLVNRYSFTAPDFPWQTHEWLSEVLVAHASDPLLFAAGMLLGWAPILLVLRVSGSWPALAGALVLAIETGFAGLVLRPYLLGRALLAGVLALRRPPPWWAALAAFALWVNLHGSFGYGLFVLGLRALFALRRPEARGWLLALAAACAGVLLNPYGLPGALFPLRYLGARPFVAHVIEWQPSTGAALPWLLLAALPGAVALARGTRLAARALPLAHDLLLWLAFLALAAGARRGLPDLALVSALLLARAFPADPLRLRFALLPAAAALLLPVCGYPRFLEGQSRARPAGLLAHLAAMPHPPSRLFNEFNWGGAFFALAPRTRVFIDARNDCYPLAVIEDYFSATPETLDRYGADAAALRSDAPLAGELRSRGWRAAYEDAQATLLLRP